MAIYALQSKDYLERQLERMQSMNRMVHMDVENPVVGEPQKASFFDIFKNMVTNVIETNEQADRDVLDLMLGNTDDLATVMVNVTKANTAVDLLVSVKNEVISSYNSIINMQI